MLLGVAAASAQLLNQTLRFLWLSSSDTFELQSCARLLATTLTRPLLLRGVFLVAGGIALPLSGYHLTRFAALPVALAGEILGRYLFYVSVVPKNLAAPYLSAQERAA